MIFSQTIEYALRAMAQLAAMPAGEAATSKELSGQTGIPTHYLSKILRRLVAAGLLESGKGHHGGFRLAKPASAVSFRSVLIALDADCDPNRCAFGWGKCNAQNPCLLHPAFTRLNASVCDWADHSTLGDLLAQRKLERASSSRAGPARRKAARAL